MKVNIKRFNMVCLFKKNEKSISISNYYVRFCWYFKVFDDIKYSLSLECINMNFINVVLEVKWFV